MPIERQERELFVRRVSRLLANAMQAVERDLGRVDTGEVARRVAWNLWGETQVKKHGSTGEWVKHVRGTLGLTQQQFAQKLDTSQITVSRWESGKVSPSKPYMKAIEHMARRKWVWDESDD